MLIIRNEQLEALRAAAANEFPAEALRHLAEVLPAELDRLGKTEAVALIGRGIHVALSSGIRRDEDVMAFLELLVVSGPGFEAELAEPWARDTLENSGISGQAKLQLLRLRRPTLQQPD